MRRSPSLLSCSPRRHGNLIQVDVPHSWQQRQSEPRSTSKESVLDELGKSPNEADALVMAFWYLDVVIGLGIV